jgi:hypothetical protein
MVHDVPCRFFLGIGQPDPLVGKKALDRHEAIPSYFYYCEGIISLLLLFVKGKMQKNEKGGKTIFPPEILVLWKIFQERGSSKRQFSHL